MHVAAAHRATLKYLLASSLLVVMLPAAFAATTTDPAVAEAPAVAGPPAAAADTTPGGITLHVKSARSVAPGAGFVHANDPVTTYKWIINQDDTGDPGTFANQGTQSCLPPGAEGGSSNPDFADSCPWPSIRKTSGFAPIIAQGDEKDLNGTKALDGLAPGKYLISVTAKGFKIDGQHFTVGAGSTQAVTVLMNPTPLPLSTIRIQVFNDNIPVDATYEADAEEGLKGFTAHLTDVFGEVSVDYYGNALCTVYEHVNADGTGPIVFDDSNHPVVDTTKSTGRCVSDASGEIVIPNLGPNRYAATVAPPAGEADQWVQTTTLEGARDFDIWNQEGETGYDNEVIKGAEKVPMVQFGFVHPKQIDLSADHVPTGEVKGVVVAGLPYIGGAPGLSYETGFPGAKSDGPINKPWVALSDLSGGDAAIYVGRGAADGSFDIQHVPDGTYQLSMWDDDIDYILWSFNVEVRNGGVSNVGNKALTGWFTHLHGHVFVDDNANGKRDPGEKAVPQFPLSIRERDNSLMDQYTNTAVTDSTGAYDIREVYPLGKWLVEEAFDTRYQTTGISYRGENEKEWTTKLGGLVDLDFLPIIGLGGEVDWGVQPYDPGTNGGIAGTVSYDTTRNELDPAEAVSESYQPGIPDLTVNLYSSLPCPTGLTDAEKADRCRQGKEIVPLSDTSNPDRGAFKRSPLLASTVTETWQPPKGCTAYDYKGRVLSDQRALPEFGEEADRTCLEAPMMGVAIGPSDKTPGDAGQTVNGNYGFGTSDVNQFPVGDPRNTHDLPLWAPLPDGETQDLRPGDYLVSVDIPDNPVGDPQNPTPMYRVTGEEDVNVFQGDSYLPQENLASITLSQADDTPAGDAPAPTQPPSQQAGITSPCGGPLHKVDVTDPTFLDGGGSPFQGQDRPSCQTKLVTVRDGQATAPNFNLFTDVPIPTHFWGVTLNDLGLTFDKRSVNYGEAQGLPFVPVGLYDYAGRLLDTVHTDFNGLYEALEPSTDTYNCPVPAGPCPNMYRFVGNDPGQPADALHPTSRLNADYNPRFRTIAASFQAWPGLYTVTDEAPTQVANVALSPDTTVANPTQCDLGNDYPQLYAVDHPFVDRSGAVAQRTVTIKGVNFGATAGTLKLGGTPVQNPTWSDESIQFTVPINATAGARALTVTNARGFTSYNGLTLQVVTGGSTNSPTNPRIVQVRPGTALDTVQKGLDAARPTSSSTRYNLVVVWPNTQTSDNPRGEYTENVIMGHRVQLQGVGPGGFTANGTYVPGSVLDGLGFNPDNQQGADWLTTLGGLSYSGDQEVPDAAVVTVLNPTGFGSLNEPNPSTYPPAINGFTITGGVQLDFPTNLNTVLGGVKTPYGATGALLTQGGGVYVHNGVRNLQITDNVIRGNGGSYGGGVRVGTPYENSNSPFNPGSGNTDLVLARNQIRDNGGTNLAGGVGIFGGSDRYAVTGNAICGNFSAEYGGALTVFGYQGTTGGRISGNRVWFNGSYDEGGGVMVAGELPSTPTALSHGSGPVSIDHNVISSNIANDDGGGIRLLQVSGDHVSRQNLGRVTISNNTVVNNVSAHEGGGIALDDAVFVDVVHNTVARNLTTATAVTSDGSPAAAGLSTAANSDPLMDRLRSQFGSTSTVATTPFSKPTVLNDLFWDNRAGTYSGGVVTGLGKLPNGFDGGIENWDMGMTDTPSGLLTPQGTVLQTIRGTNVSAALPGSNRVTDAPGLKDPYLLSVDVLASRTYPAFRQSMVIAELLPPNLMGDYHLADTTSPAYRQGVFGLSVPWASGLTYTVAEPTDDIDGDGRPTQAGSTRKWDSGSDQVSTVAAAPGATPLPGLRGLATPLAALMSLVPTTTPGTTGTVPATPPATVPKVATRLTARPTATRTRKGHRVTLVATVSPSASGQVVFKQGTKTLCSAATRSGKATCRTSTRLARGLHRVVATYGGSATRLRSTARTWFRIT